MRRPLLHIAIWLAAGGSVAGGRALAQPAGFLDDGFFGDGKTTIAPSGENRRITAVAAAPDGRLVVAGSRWLQTGENTLFWRALTDGSAGPLCSPAAPGGALFASPTAIAFDAQGRLLIAGTAAPPGGAGYDGMLLRYLYPGCTLDTTFSGDGVFLTGLSGTDHFYDIALDSLGRIVAVGVKLHGPTQDHALLVARLTSAGAFDGSFSGDGWLEALWGPGATFGQGAVQADDKVVAGGTIDGGALGTLFLLARFDTAGAFDPTFGSDGDVAFDFPFGEDDRLADIVIDPVSGKILVAGSSDDTDLGVTRSVVARLTPTGVLDSTFDGDGRWEESSFAFEEVTALVLQSDGKILIAGDAANPGGDREFFAYRLHPDGGADTGFGFFGVTAAQFDLGGTNDDLVRAACLQSGKLVVAGSADNGTDTVGAVARFWSELIFSDGFERGSSAAWGSH